LSGRSRLRSALALVVVLAGAAAGCGGAPILANPPLIFPTPPVASLSPAGLHDPVAISLPRDDGPHRRLTEWWYYTGHLQAGDGRRFGFEAVIFRAERGSVPAAWASHLALTDESGRRFLYAQRSEIGLQVDRSARDRGGDPTGFDLQIRGLSPTLIAAGAPPTAAPWRLAGANGADTIEAALSPEEAAPSGGAFGLSLELDAMKAPVLHDGDGFVDFGPAGSSYYYSRTRMAATGALQLDGERLTVDGIAWFDHQWGDFLSVGAGGWDWFAINLDDGTDITISVVRDEHAGEVLRYGTLVRPSGEVVHLRPDDFGIADANAFWESPVSHRNYVISRTVLIGQDTAILLRPTLREQELDTRATTGVIYWEGSQDVEVTTTFADGTQLPNGAGEAYVEITRYDLPNQVGAVAPRPVSPLVRPPLRRASRRRRR
jgi:predicted secreted hydrolase